jgi:hypothetical protein
MYITSKTVVATEFLTFKNNGCVDVLDLIAYLASGIFDVTVFILHPKRGQGWTRNIYMPRIVSMAVLFVVSIRAVARRKLWPSQMLSRIPQQSNHRRVLRNANFPSNLFHQCPLGLLVGCKGFTLTNPISRYPFIIFLCTSWEVVVFLCCFHQCCDGSPRRQPSLTHSLWPSKMINRRLSLAFSSFHSYEFRLCSKKKKRTYGMLWVCSNFDRVKTTCIVEFVLRVVGKCQKKMSAMPVSTR